MLIRDRLYKLWIKVSPLKSRSRKVFLGKSVLKICSKFTREHPCRSAISIKFFCYFIEITLRHGCSPVNSRHIFRTPFLKDTSVRLFLEITKKNKMKRNIKKLVPNEQKHTETTTSISVTNFKQ